MSVPVKSALKSPVSRFSTSNGWSVTSNSPSWTTPPGTGPPPTMRAVVLTCTFVSGLRADDREEGAEVGAEVLRRVLARRDRLRPADDDVGAAAAATERGRGEEQRGVVREHVDVLERVELVGDDRDVGANAIGAARERGVRPGVERARGEPSTSCGPSLKTSRLRGPMRAVATVRTCCGRSDARRVLVDGDRRDEVRLGVRHDDGELLRRGVALRRSPRCRGRPPSTRSRRWSARARRTRRGSCRRPGDTRCPSRRRRSRPSCVSGRRLRSAPRRSRRRTRSRADTPCTAGGRARTRGRACRSRRA